MNRKAYKAACSEARSEYTRPMSVKIVADLNRTLSTYGARERGRCFRYMQRAHDWINAARLPYDDSKALGHQGRGGNAVGEAQAAYGATRHHERANARYWIKSAREMLTSGYASRLP